MISLKVERGTGNGAGWRGAEGPITQTAGADRVLKVNYLLVVVVLIAVAVPSFVTLI